MSADAGAARSPAPLALDPEELAGDLPMVCARTGRPASAMAPVWYASSPRWAWLPLLVLAAVAAVRGSWAPLASWWTAAAVLLPVLTSRGVAGRLPLDAEVIGRIAALRRRRIRAVMAGLGLTWVAVALWLLTARAAALLVLAAVVALHLAGVGMTVAARGLAGRGRPAPDGGAVLLDPHPGFVDAVELRRTGHRP